MSDKDNCEEMSIEEMSIEEISRIYELHIDKSDKRRPDPLLQKKSYPIKEAKVSTDIDPSLFAQDVVLVTATTDEYRELMRSFPKPYQETIKYGLCIDLLKLQTTEKELSVACINIDGMGPVKAAIVGTKIMLTLRPKLAVMTGVCATGQDGIDLGDIVVGERAYDYDAGKLEDGLFSPEYEPVEVAPHTRTVLSRLCREKSVCQSVHEDFEYEDGKPKNPPKIHLGTFASGSKVVADNDYVQQIRQHQRKIHGIDMESYAFYRACWEAATTPISFFTVKSVQDKANSDKNDAIRQYCSYVSAAFVKSILIGQGQLLWETQDT